MDSQETSGVGKYIWGIIVIAVIIVGVGLMSSKKNEPELKDSGITTGMPTIDNVGQPEMEVNNDAPVITYTPTEAVEVEYTEQGFAPKEISIKQGDSVKFINKSSGQMWVASAMHPSHKIYSGTALNEHCPDSKSDAFDQCSAGQEFLFIFNKAGSWNYHNHLNASQFGKVVVSAN